MTFVVLTGGSSGIGRAAALQLAGAGAEIALIGRTPNRVREAAALARATGGAPIHEYVADLGEMVQVRALGARLLANHERIDVLANNAGAMFATRQLTSEGLERTFAVNHMAAFLLTDLLLPRLLESRGRVVTTSSVAHLSGRIDLNDLQRERGYTQYAAYAGSKLCNVLFTRELARRHAEALSATCFHPGLVRTDLTREANLLWRLGATIGAPFIRSPERAADTLAWLGLDVRARTFSGQYFEDRSLQAPSPTAQDRQLALGLWERSVLATTRTSLFGSDQAD